MAIGSDLDLVIVGGGIGGLPTPPALPQIVGINLPQPETETPNDLTTTAALLTNSDNQVSQTH
jgi:hypothetical protein